MKLKKREIGYFILIIFVTLLFKQTVVDILLGKLGVRIQLNAEFLKLTGVLLNIIIGFAGLMRHEVKWIKTVWLSIYSMLLLIIIVDKFTEYAFDYSLTGFDYSLFVSPVFYLVACVLTRYVALEHDNINQQKAE